MGGKHSENRRFVARRPGGYGGVTAVPAGLDSYGWGNYRGGAILSGGIPIRGQHTNKDSAIMGTVLLGGKGKRDRMTCASVAVGQGTSELTAKSSRASHVETYSSNLEQGRDCRLVQKEQQINDKYYLSLSEYYDFFELPFGF